MQQMRFRNDYSSDRPWPTGIVCLSVSDRQVWLLDKQTINGELYTRGWLLAAELW